MGIRLPKILDAKKILQKMHKANDIPKGHLIVYVGETSQRKRFVVPVSYLNHPSFKQLLDLAEEEFGFDHPISGGLTIPCCEQLFMEMTSDLAIS